MLFRHSLPIIALVAPALGQDAGVASVISELSAVITDIPSLVLADGPALITELAGLISMVDPTGVVSDIPSLLSAGEGAIESYLDGALSAAIPPGAFPTSILAEIPEVVSEIVPAAISALDEHITELPATLSLVAIPSMLSAHLSEIATEAAALVSMELPALSTLLANAGVAPTPYANASTLATTTIAPSASLTATSSTSFPTVTAAAAALLWQAEIALLAGLAAVVALL